MQELPHGRSEITAKETGMNWDQVEGNWMQMKGKVKETWGDLTDSDIKKIEGKRDRLAGVLQERYGKKKDEIEKEIDGWLNRH